MCVFKNNSSETKRGYSATASSRRPVTLQPTQYQIIQSSLYQFSYAFGTGYVLSGQMVGNVISKLPSLVFNLQSLQAVLCSKEQKPILHFHEVYGQFKLSTPEVLLFGSNPKTGSFFSFNYRCEEASVFDNAHKEWVVSGWHPARWQVTKIGCIEYSSKELSA
jgi:hypothetical protein